MDCSGSVTGKQYAMKEEILTEQELIDCVFDNRKNEIQLDGIREYFKRNNEYYSLKTTFVVNSMIIGAYRLYHEKENMLNQ